MQVLNFNSNHPISHKRSCVRTLYRRIETQCSEPEDKVTEIQYLRRMFGENGYPRDFVNWCMRRRDEPQNRTDPKFWRTIPYVKNMLEAHGRLLAPLAQGQKEEKEEEDDDDDDEEEEEEEEEEDADVADGKMTANQVNSCSIGGI
ncbi:unnamed protein product [Dibothriocephalus latus]|uniref:Helix-turn-helix domain-containing protein n=1 Tax=Dibothriocephalus latus TaxID=60516 RepID=A0A3P7L5R6_DIBLA|nr:unnamed protein product [Dibothriocephalus latus]